MYVTSRDIHVHVHFTQVCVWVRYCQEVLQQCEPTLAGVQGTQAVVLTVAHTTTFQHAHFVSGRIGVVYIIAYLGRPLCPVAGGVVQCGRGYVNN